MRLALRHLRRNSCLLLLIVAGGAAIADIVPQPGLNLTFTVPGSSGLADAIVAPNAAFYVPAGQPPTPFLPAGPFTATADGFVTVDQDSDLPFEAELNGRLRIEINGSVVLDAATNGLATAAKPVHLNQGTNALKLRFTAPAAGDAYVRIHWQPDNSFPAPIPSAALTRDASAPDAVRAAAAHLGRELFIEDHCIRCHAAPSAGPAIPELAMDAPEYAGIGSRRNYAWMVRWIEDPGSLRLAARMPKVLHGADAPDEARAIAAYLASLKSNTASSGAAPDPDQSGSGRALFNALHCVACHFPPDAAETNAARIPLRHVREKFAPAALAEFLMAPAAHYAWIRMPNFKFTSAEAGRLASYLWFTADQPDTNAPAAPSDPAVLEHGRQLVQSSGCLNCHTLNIENHFTAPTLAALTPDKWNGGCLAADSSHAGGAPVFHLDPEARAALAAFGATDRASLTRHVPAEFADRQSRVLNCRECHGKFDGFPAFDILGGKLRPEWSRAFIAGETTNRPRPWLDARMPAFARRAEGLAQGMAMLHGYPPVSPPEPPVDMDKAETGRHLVAVAGGFSCVTCHGIGSTPARAFEVNGINLALTASRVRGSYVRRWIRNPQLIDPSAKMPLFFDNTGISPLTDVYDGSTARQIDALWEYIRLGDQMQPPPYP
jgi:mono/diheme cytochrome c family protein